MTDAKILAQHLLQSQLEDLTDRERKVLERLATRRRISRNLNRVLDAETTFGDRLSDRVASFGGSWAFIILFGVILSAWILGNTLVVLGRGHAIDPYPFIFLNLILSMIAAFQAPIIMMSQNRQAAKDRAAVAHDYEVNLKAELEIMQLHEKLDEIRQNQMAVMLEKQEQHLELLDKMLTRLSSLDDRAS